MAILQSLFKNISFFNRYKLTEKITLMLQILTLYSVNIVYFPTILWPHLDHISDSPPHFMWECHICHTEGKLSLAIRPSWELELHLDPKLIVSVLKAQNKLLDLWGMRRWKMYNSRVLTIMDVSPIYRMQIFIPGIQTDKRHVCCDVHMTHFK